MRQADRGSKRAAIVASMVSSRALATVGKKMGFEFYTTPTGFKNMGNKQRDLAEEGVTPLMAYEESIGFTVGGVVFDKDGVTSAGEWRGDALALTRRLSGHGTAGGGSVRSREDSRCAHDGARSARRLCLDASAGAVHHVWQFPGGKWLRFFAVTCAHGDGV